MPWTGGERVMVLDGVYSFFPIIVIQLITGDSSELKRTAVFVQSRVLPRESEPRDGPIVRLAY